ncbi:MAG: hypothetical protein PGN29_04450 [Gordonia paraffinivorans]
MTTHSFLTGHLSDCSIVAVVVALAVIWITVSCVVAVVIGRAIRVADRRDRSSSTPPVDDGAGSDRLVLV